MKRRTCSPHVCSESRENRSWLSGMRISAVQPPLSICVAASQMGSQPLSQHDELTPIWSCRLPLGFTMKKARPRWS